MLLDIPESLQYGALALAWLLSAGVMGLLAWIVKRITDKHLTAVDEIVQALKSINSTLESLQRRIEHIESRLDRR
jgi:hypothetical protein